MFAWFVPVAFAGGFGVEATHDVGVEPLAVAASGGWIAVAGADDTVLVGRTTVSLGRGALSVAAYDGFVLCDRDGLSWVSLEAPEPLPPVQVSAEPCEAVVAGDLGVVASGDGLIALDPAAGWADTALPWGSGASASVLAARPGAIAAATIGGTELWTSDGATETLPGAIVSLSAAESGFAATLPSVRLAGPIADLQAFDAVPGDLASADVDGDGRLDVAVAAGDEIVLLLATGDVATVELPGAIALWGGQADADACGEIVVGTASGRAEVIGATPCGDLDGDGWSADLGDCDDRDATRNPGAAEGCDGVDQDCDGEVDELQVWLDAPSTADEGDAIDVRGVPDGCGADLDAAIAVSASAGPFTCVVSGAEATCELHDDGLLTLLAFTSDGSARGSRDVVVRNVAPTLAETPLVHVVGDAVLIDAECGAIVDLAALDPGDDTAWFGGLASAEGRVEIPDGALYGELVVGDEDGGVHAYTLDAFGSCEHDTSGGWDTGDGWEDWDSGGGWGSASTSCNAEDDDAEDDGCDEEASHDFCCFLGVLMIFGVARRGIGLP